MQGVSYGASSTGASIGDKIQGAQQAGIDAAFAKAASVLDPLINTGSSNPPNFMGDHAQVPATWTDVVNDVALAYEGALDAAVGGALGSGAATDNSDKWTSNGWIAAGAYYNNMARAQGDIETAMMSSVPRFTPPDIRFPDADGSIWRRVPAGLINLDKWLRNSDTKAAAIVPPAAQTGNTSNTSVCNMSTITAAKTILADAGKDLKEAWESQHVDVMDLIARMADAVAAMNCVWSSSPNLGKDVNGVATPFTLGISFSTANPYTELVRLGYANLNTSYQLLYVVVLADAASGAIEGFTNAVGKNVFVKTGAQLTSGVTGLFTGIISFLALLFFAAGFTLAYFLPLIPFMTFLMNTLTWLIMVIESVIMMPLVALAHLNPEGDGLPGQNARNAYFFLFSIMLRPVLMVFGLICSWLIFVSGVVLMNKLYLVAVTGALSIGGDAHVFVSRLAFSIMYVIILYIICHKSFDLIGSLPNHAMAWIGAQDAPKESMGNAVQNLGGSISTISSIAGQQLFGAVGKSGEQLKGTFKNAGERLAPPTVATVRTIPAAPPRRP